MTAGIYDIKIYIPRLYIDAEDFAKARGLDPVKLQKELVVSQMAMVDSNQDPTILHSKKEFVLVDVKTDEASRGERRYSFNE